MQITIFESVQQLEQGLGFQWAPNFAKLKEISKNLNGKFLLVEAIRPMITDPFSQGHGAREWTEKELMKTAYTAVGKKLNINHSVKLNPRYRHEIADAEYNEATKTLEMIVYEEDPEILRLIREGYITKVSIQGTPRRQSTNCKSGVCTTVPEGVILGEGDGEALAYVVTKEAYYNGQKLEANVPGDWNSTVIIAETNALNPVVSKNTILDAQLREKLTKIGETKIIKEDLNDFNSAINSGDAIKALMILADSVYAEKPEQEQKPEPAEEKPEQEQPAVQKEADRIQSLESELAKIKADMTTQTEEISLRILEHLTPKINELVANNTAVSSLKESMKNLSTQVQESYKELKHQPRPPLMEVNSSNIKPEKFDVSKAREIINRHIE